MFTYDSPFSQIMIRIAHCFLLSVLWLLSSLPVVTVGAATTAVHAVTLKLVHKKDISVFAEYKRAFRANFKKATAIWLLSVAAVVILSGDIIFFSGASGWIKTVCCLFFFVLLIVVGLMLMVVFHLQACFVNSVGNTIRNALRFALGYLSTSSGLLILFVLCLYCISQIAWVFPVIIFLGTGLFSYLSSLLWDKAFTPFYQQTELSM